jgi:WD40 repeat protein
LLAVVGASGSGKSSVLRAGVVAAVRAGEANGLGHASLLTPGAAPALDLDDAPDRLVVVDQFEQLFTLCDDADARRAFIDALLAVGGPVAIGVRADLYGKLATHPELAQAVADNQILLGAMSDDELERAVREPARLTGLRLQPGLVELALRDVAGEPGALPLLSHALRATWERRDGRTLTVDGYRHSGGVSAAIARTADSVVASLPADQRQMTRNIFLRLTELGEGVADTRRSATIEELVPEGASRPVVEAVLDRLAEARLVTLGEGTAEVAHEVLIRQWPTLRAWLDEDREGVRLHRRLGDAARLWETGGREPTDLYRGTRLGATAEWARAHRADLNANERAFIDASSAEADRERRADRRTNRRLRGLLAGAAILLVVALLAVSASLVQRNRAQGQALTSDAERVGTAALTEQNVDRSLLDAVAAVRLEDRVETRSDLLAVMQKNSALVRMTRPFADTLDGVQVSPDGRLLAVADSSGAVRFIDMATWKPAGADVHLRSPVAPRAMSFSPDGRTLMVMTVGTALTELVAIDVTTRRARRVRAWRGAVPTPPLGSAGVAYSPDGRRLAVSLIRESDPDPTPSAERVAVLDPANGRRIWERRYPLRPGQEEPHVAFTPAGVLLTSAQHGDTLLWNVRDGRIVRRFGVGGLPAVSHDGREVALGMNNAFEGGIPSASVAVIDLRTGRHRTLPARLPTAWIRGIALTPDGSTIVAGAFDGVHVWDVAAGTITESYTGQPGQRSVFTLDPRSATAIFGAQDGSVAAFDVSGRRGAARAPHWSGPGGCSGQSGPCDAVSPSSDLLADTQDDGSVALVSLRTDRLAKMLPPRDGRDAGAVSFLPDGTLVNGGDNGDVTLWNTRTGRVVRELRFAAPVVWTAASPDGRSVAVQTHSVRSTDSSVAVVQLATGRVLQRHTVRDGFGYLHFSRDGRELVALGCCTRGSIVVAWDAHSGRQLFSRVRDGASAIDITPDSRLVGVAREDGKVLFLDARSGKPARPPLQAAAGNILSLSFSADGRSLAVSGADNAVSLWDLPSRKRLGNPFGPYPGTIPGTLFEPNGRLLIELAERADDWPTDVGTWARFACRAAGRDLTHAEWRDILPNRPYRHVCRAPWPR